MKKYSFIISLLIPLLLFGALNAVAAPGDFLFEFGDDYRLTNPRGVAVDGSGNVYVADTNNHRIQVFTATGTFLRKWGDYGSGNGQFSYPGDIAVDGNGNVYVADTSNNRVQVFTGTGTFLRKWGTTGSGDGQFNTPNGVGVDGSGNVYVADSNNNRVQVFTGTGTFLRKWGTTGPGDGQFNTPNDVAVDGSGNVYVADTSNNRIQVFTGTGTFLSKWGIFGTGDGQFRSPRSIAVDGSGNVYVADTSNNRVQVFTGTGTFLRKWGASGSGNGQFLSPYGIAVDGSGNVYVADSSNHRVQVFTGTGTFLRKWGTTGSGDGQFNTPYGVAVDESGNVYVADSSNNRVQVFTDTGAFLRKWGTSGSGDGQFNTPYGIAVDGSGNVYVADTSNNRIQVFTATGAFLRQWGIYGTGAGQFKSPGGVAVDGSGNVYVADTYNNRIQVFTSTGTFLTGWGGVLGSGNGQFSSPRGIAVDESGNVYVADTNNHRIQVFTGSGAFLMKLGTSGSGDGQLIYPHSVALNGSGNVYVADTNNHRVQAFTTAGTFVRQWGIYGSGEGQFKYPRGIAADGSGNVYVVDTNNHRIQAFEGLVLIDSASPTTILSLSGTSGNNGWHISDVQVSLTATDAAGGSGINNTEYSFDGTNWNTYTAPFTITTEGITTVYYGSIDNAGNIEATKSQTIQIDRTSPEISGSALPAPNTYGWNNTDVTVSFTGTDALSGIDTCTNITLNNDGTGQSGTGTCTDKAGNISTTATVSGISIDKTPPAISGSASPAPNAYGWNNTDVTVSISGTDLLSGIDTCTNAVTLSSDGAGQSAGGTCTDRAGNISVTPLTLNIDKTPPTVSVSALPAPNADGWNNTDVTVSFTGTDALSGIDTCTGAATLSGEGAGQLRGGTCTDKAGNVSVTATVSGINIDKTSPTISGSALPAPNAYGWNNTNVTVSFTGIDSLSGIDSCTNATLSNDGAGQPGTGTCTDKAGNISVTATVNGINIDKTPPAISGSASPAPNAYGWNNTDVTVSFTGTDALSGIDTCTNAVILSNDGTGQLAGGTCTDRAGNISVTPLTLNIDKTPPTVSGNALPAPNANGWNSTAVTVSFSGIDLLSGVDTCTNAVILSNDGPGQSASGTCTDKAGNVSTTATVSGINIDNTLSAPGDFLFEFGDDYRLTNPRGVAVDGSGNVYVADTNNHRIQVFTATGTFLRKWGDYGSGNGQFSYPGDIAVDGNGNVYVADTSNNRVQVFTGTGTFLRKWGTTGSGDGQFNTPNGVGVDGSGNVYVADSNNNRVQVFTGTGTFLRKWGTTGPGDGQFNTPNDVAVDGSGNVYVADTSNNRIQVFTGTGTFLSKWGIFGTGDGQLRSPRSIAVDGSGNVYVADTSNNRVQVFTGTGTFLRKWGASGSGNGQFLSPYGIAVDGSGNVYVADSSNHRVQVFTGTGTFLRKWGTTGSGDGQFNTPYGVAVDESGNVYVADSSNNRVQVFTDTGAFLRKWGTSGSGDGQFNTPYGIAVDGSGNVYVADTSNNRIQVFTATGAFLRQWGIYGTGAGQFKSPGGVAVDGSGNVYVADTYNNRIQVFTSTGTFLTGWGGVLGSGNGQFSSPRGIAVDESGNVYVADTNNHRIQVFTGSGAFLMKLGTSGSGDGQLIYPHSILLDGNGNVYVADTNNHRIQVFTTAGTFVRKWGVYGSGDGQFKYPRGIAADGNGDVYVVDTNNHRVQVFEGEGGTGTMPIDSIAPATSISLSGTSGNNGWHISDVQVSLTAMDEEGGSGIDKTEYSFDGTNWNTYAAPFTISTEGMTTVYYRSVDNAGNIETTKSQTIQIDKTPPTISGNALPAPNTYGWNNTDVTVSFTGTDALSGIDTCTGAATLSGDGANLSAGGICTDKAGNVSVTATISGINIDKTPPTVSANVLPAPNAYGWNNTDVTVSFTGTDALSGINTCTGASTLGDEGAGQAAGGTCTDMAGNTGTATIAINIDKTSPTISGSALPAPNPNGWNDTDITVSFTGADALSGIGTCTSPITLSQEGSGQSASGTCTDKAGNNSETATVSGINIDKPSPEVGQGIGLPVANAGEDLTIQSSQVGSAAVQGTATDAATCRWTETGMTGNILSMLQDWAPAGPNGACPLNLSSLSLGIGVHSLTLEASGGTVTSLDNMTLTITNSVPNVNAGDDLTVTTPVEAAAVVIQGSATDFDGNNLSCRWMAGTTVLQAWTPAGTNGACPLDLSALSLGKGTHILTLEADDGEATSTDYMLMTIKNTPPVAEAGDDITIPSNQVGSTTVQGTVTDADDAYTFTCRWMEGVTVVQDWASAGQNGTCPLNLSSLSLGIGVHSLTLEANDGQTTSSDTMSLTINNSVPNANAGNDLTVTTEEVVATVIQGSATDFDGNNLSCRWMEGTTALQAWTTAGPTGECPLDLSALSLGKGTHILTLTTRDELATSSDDMVLTINNTPPVANAGENITTTSVLVATTTVHGGATDFDGDTLSYRWTVDGTPQPGWIPGVPALDLTAFTLGIGLHTLILEVNDGETTSSDGMLLTVDNSAPNAAAGGSGIYEIGTSVILTGSISDFDGDMLNYAWTDGTDILCIGHIQSTAGGTPSTLPECAVNGLGLGTYTISLAISDGLNVLQTDSVTVQLTDSSAPTLAPEANTYILWPPNHKLVNVTIAANASDNSGSAVTLAATITSNEPAESSETGDIGPDWTEPVINQTTGMIYTQLRAERSGRGEGRTYTVTITATDTSGNVSTAKVNILVPHDQKK